MVLEVLLLFSSAGPLNYSSLGGKGAEDAIDR